MNGGRRTIDPVVLEVISHELQSIPDLVEVDLTRTAFSPLIYEYKDYAVGLVDADGRSIALARQGGPGFVVNLIGLGAREALERHGATLSRGDVIVTNSTTTVGHHLNDVVMVTPVFDAADTLVAFMGIIAHWIDIGGRYPLSCSGTDTTDIFQEGLQLNCIHLRRAGQWAPGIRELILGNSRLPDMLMGDINAQLAGCLKGAGLYGELLDRHGPRTLDQAIGEIWRRSADEAYAAVEEIPDGEYSMECFLDNDGLDLDRRIPIRVRVIVKGSSFTVDFSGMSPQVRGPFNSGRYGGGDACARIAFKYLVSPSSPTNEGSFAPLSVVLPPGTLVSADREAPLGRYSVPLPTIVDSIVAAMAPAMPDRAAAGHHASFGSFGFFGMDPATGRNFAFFDTAHGGWGATLGRDGVGPYKTMIHGDNRDIPVEVQEALYPVEIERYEWRPDSGGPGRLRGGLGTTKTYRVTTQCHAQVAFERYGCPPWGLFGGEAGQPGWTEVERTDGSREFVLKASDLPMNEGDRLHVFTGGGGGYGPPSERDRVVLQRDVELGYITRDQAAARYSRNE